MYKVTDNLIGIEFKSGNDIYRIISNNSILHVKENNEYGGYTKNEFCMYFNHKDWKVINHKVIHELW
jgi:hypothetical protein